MTDENRTFHGQNVEFGGSADKAYVTELDKLEALMMDASAAEYNRFETKVTYEAIVQVQTESAAKAIHVLHVSVNRNQHVLCEIKQFSNKSVDKASAVREMITLFKKFGRLCLLTKKDFIIYNDPNDLKSIAINKVTHNDRAKKILTVDHNGVEMVVEYDKVIGVEDPTGETINEFRGLYLIFDRDHPAMIRIIKKDHKSE